jgi:hypothetical protein
MSPKVQTYLAFDAVVVGLAGPKLADLLLSDGLKLPTTIVSALVVLAAAVKLAALPQLGSSSEPPKDGAK